MAKRKQIIDVYPNRIVERVVMSGTDTITFEPIRFGTGIFSGIALVIHRLEYHVNQGTMAQLVATTDALYCGLTNRDDLANLLPMNLNLLDVNSIFCTMVGTVVSLTIERFPILKDFTTLPGMGLIIPTTPLFLAMQTAGFASAGTIDLVMYYTFKTMSDADYIELVQGMLPANI